MTLQRSVHWQWKSSRNRIGKKATLEGVMKLDKTVLCATVLPPIIFLLLLHAYVPYVPVGIPELDPPPDGNKAAIGLVFEEYNCIGGDKYFDDHIWSFMALPRGNVYRNPIDIWNSDATPSSKVPYVYANYNYTSGCIIPPLPVPIPIEGRYLAGLNVNHKINGLDSWPQILVVNGDGYLRLTAEPPREFGTSYRLATHNVGSNTPPEDFPRIVKVSTKVVDQSAARLTYLVDSEAFTGDLTSDLTPGAESTMDVQATFTMRRDLNLSSEPNTGFVGMSSMFWKGEADTPAITQDEAHDADMLVVKYSDGSKAEYPLYNVASNTPIVTSFPPPAGKKIVAFALEQRDRDQTHYSDYGSAEYEKRISFAVENIEASIPFQVTLHIFPTDSEYHDNIVAHLTVLENLSKGQQVNISYRAQAY